MAKMTCLPPFPKSPLPFLFPLTSHFLSQKAQKILTQTQYVCEHQLFLTSSSANALLFPICQHKKLLCQGTQEDLGGTLLTLPDPHSFDNCPGSSSPNISPAQEDPLWEVAGPFPQLLRLASPSPQDISDKPATSAPTPGSLRVLPNRVVAAMETHLH